MTVKKLATTAFTIGALFCAASTATAQTTLKIQTSTQSGGYSFDYLKDNWVPRLEAMSGGELTIEFFPINSIVDRKETPEAVMAGVLSGDLTSVAYFSGRNPAFAIMGDMIAGYDTPEQIQTFCRHGGGRDALYVPVQRVVDGH